MNDDSLSQEDIPGRVSEPFPPLQPIATQPLGDCEKSYYIAEKGYSYKELLSIISHLISILAKGNVNEHKITNQDSSKNQQLIFQHQEVFLPRKKYKNINNLWKF